MASIPDGGRTALTSPAVTPARRRGFLHFALAALCLAFVTPLPAQTELQKAVDEFKVQASSLGLIAGAAARASSAKAATARWHGRIYENIRNDFLDAIPHQIYQLGGRKAVLRRNQFGLNVSGPLVIPKLYDGSGKTFFSFSYEGVRDHTARSFLQTLATASERLGDFSGTVDQAGAFLPIYDPASTRLNPDYNPAQPVSPQNLQYLRTPFPLNRIDPSRLSSVALKTLDYYPAPNIAVGPFNRNNYFLVTAQTNNADGIILNVDHTIRKRHRISLNFNHTVGLNGSAAMLPTAANPASPDRRTIDPWGSVDYVFTKSPQTVNKVSVYMETYQTRAGEERLPDYAARIGLTGSSPLAFPSFSISPYVSMGTSYPRSDYAQNYYSLSENLTVKRGKHSLTFVATRYLYHFKSYEAAYPAGNFRFDEGLTSLPGIVGTGHAFASFLLGLAAYAEKSYVVSPSYFRTASASASARDQYQVHKGLTLTFGLAVQSWTPRTEKYDRQSSVDLSVVNPVNSRLGAMVVTGAGGLGRSLQSTPVNWEPNASLAWNVFGDAKTVLRANFSLYHGGYLSSSIFATQAFNAAPVYLSANTQLEPAVAFATGLPPLARPLPDLRPEALNDTNADMVYRGLTRPVYQSAALSVERQLPLSTVVTLGWSEGGGRDTYVGNSVANLNAISLAALGYRDQLYDETFNRSLRPYPQYKTLNTGGLYPAGRYFTQSRYVSVEKRATAGLSLNFRYTWNVRFDDYSNGRQNYFNRRNEWGPGMYNPRSMSLTYMYELPMGRGKRFLRYADWRRHLVDGWSLSGSSTYSSGMPLFLRPQFNNTGGVISNLRVNIVPGVNPLVPAPGPNGWFNPAAFDQPADFTLGNAARAYTFLTGPLSQNHDLSASKRFALPAEKTLELNAVALNFLNHANWNQPDVTIGPRSAPNVNAGKITGSTGGRVLQIGLKLSF